MQHSDRDQEKNKNLTSSSIATQGCPRCGNVKTRKSSTKTNDGLINILFCKPYRCQACRFRFWVLNPLRLIWFVGIIVLLIPVFGAFWMSSNQGVKVVEPVETVFHDQIKDLAEKGDAEAELKMGLRHTSLARGVKNDKIAVRWFEKAAQQGQVEAQYRVGWALLNGQGTVQDYKTAFYWLEKAAQQGHAQAQATLGEMYNSGVGINKNTERAYLWLNLAAAQGEVNAIAARDIVVKLLTPNQIAVLQQEAGVISRGYPPSAVAEESEAQTKETDRADIGSLSIDEPIPEPEVTEPTVKSVIRSLKEWWKNNLQ